jgi:hypothetical protein
MSVSSILSKLNDLNNSNLILVHVPSAKKEMLFKPLSVKQQKDLIKSGLDGALAGITISNIIGEIILDNSVDKYDFLVTDKLPILLALRKQSFGNEFILKENDEEVVFNLDDILKNKLNYSFDTQVEIKLADSDVVAHADVIKIQDDIKINQYQLEKLRKNKDEAISETVGSMFIYEIIKFITKILIGEDELDLTTLPIKDRITVIESVPVTLNNSILEYIQQFRKEEAEYVTVNGKVLPIDARLFAKD